MIIPQVADTRKLFEIEMIIRKFRHCRTLTQRDAHFKFHPCLHHHGVYRALLIYELMSRWRRVKYEYVGYPFHPGTGTIRWAAAHRVDQNTTNSCPVVVMSDR